MAGQPDLKLMEGITASMENIVQVEKIKAASAIVAAAMTKPIPDDPLFKAMVRDAINYLRQQL